jgi:hypothetical protein
MAYTYSKIATYTVGSGGVANITFSSIPGTYTDLALVISARNTNNDGSDNMNIAINDSSANFSGRFLFTNTNGTTSSGTDTTPSGAYNGGNTTASTFSNVSIYFPNYAGSNNKSFSVDSVAENNATQSNLYIDAKLWSNTAAITSIAFTPTTGNFVQYSTATLYGVFNADVSSAPATPTIGTATAGVQSASITFTGVSNAASYTMTSTPDSITGTGTTSPITVSGLTGGTAYTFKVKSNNPLGSSAESAASNSVTPTVPLSYESIATISAGGQTQVAFTSIPSTYSHLQLRMMVRSTINTGGYNQATVVLRINGAAIRGGIYAFHELTGNGSTAASGGTVSSQEAYGVAVPTANIASNVFGVSTIDFLDYANTNKYKTWRGITGWDDNSSLGFAKTFSGIMLETNAISSMYFSTDYNFAWASGTVFALYGIKSA